MKMKDLMYQVLTDEFKKYARWTQETAIYKTKESAITCCLLGLGGETVELYQHTLESRLDDDLIKKEFGDILWYIGHLSSVTGIVDELNIQPAEYMFDELFEYAGTIQEHFKKVVRDFDFDIESSGKRETIVLLINDFLSQIHAHIEDVYDYDFEEIMLMNKEKLNSRKDRGVISGSGDNR